MKFFLRSLPNQSRRNCKAAIDAAPEGYVVTIQAPTRTLVQNAKMWAMLAEVAEQVPDWYGNTLTAEEWKDVFTAGLKRQKMVPGIDGGIVLCGQSTSKMSVKEMIDLMDLMFAFGSDPRHPVNFSDITNEEPQGRPCER